MLTLHVANMCTYCVSQYNVADNMQRWCLGVVVYICTHICISCECFKGRSPRLHRLVFP